VSDKSKEFIVCEYEKSFIAYHTGNLKAGLVSFYRFDNCPRILRQKLKAKNEKNEALEKKQAEAVELIDCTSDRWGKCKCRSCEFLKSLEEEKEGER